MINGLSKESLRDNMTDIEVTLADLGEIATRELVKEHKPYGLKENYDEYHTTYDTLSKIFGESDDIDAYLVGGIFSAIK